VIKPHWPNPYEDAIPVTTEELAACFEGLGKGCTDVDGSRFVWTVERVLAHWSQYDGPLDAYVLPCRSGWHCMGIRYGAEGSQYLSPQGDPAKLTALIEKYIA
jgi:hypothetical protein